MRIKYHLVIALLFTLTLSCTKSPRTDKSMPDVGIPSTEFNKKIQLTVPETINTFKTKESINVVIKVISSDQIRFKSDYGVRLFVYEDTKWEEIGNDENYPAGNIILSSADNDAFKNGATVIWPHLPDTTKPVTIRIILIGNVYRGGKMTNEVTAGYIDVNVKP